jgi:hypothetical protein
MYIFIYILEQIIYRFLMMMMMLMNLGLVEIKGDLVLY